jgi:hypothetical protein
MRALVAEESIARLVTGPGVERLVVVSRAHPRRGGPWNGLEADRVVDALAGAGAGGVVLARSIDADPGAAVLPGIGRMMGHEVVLLPDEPVVAAWALGVAAHRDFPDEGLVKRLEALAGAADAAGPLPLRRVGSRGPAVPALRPRVLARWAGCAWRACGRCSGGGPAGGRCGRCGASVIAAAA